MLSRLINIKGKQSYLYFIEEKVDVTQLAVLQNSVNLKIQAITFNLISVRKCSCTILDLSIDNSLEAQ